MSNCCCQLLLAASSSMFSGFCRRRRSQTCVLLFHPIETLKRQAAGYILSCARSVMASFVAVSFLIKSSAKVDLKRGASSSSSGWGNCAKNAFEFPSMHAEGGKKKRRLLSSSTTDKSAAIHTCARYSQRETGERTGGKESAIRQQKELCSRNGLTSLYRTQCSLGPPPGPDWKTDYHGTLYTHGQERRETEKSRKMPGTAIAYKHSKQEISSLPTK